MNMFDRHIALSILMPGLLGLTPEETTGSLARAKVHFDVFLLVVKEEEQRLEEAIMDEQVIRQLVDLNFTVEAYPQFRFLPLTESILKETFDAWGMMIDKGAVKTTPEDEKHIRESLKFPDRDMEDDDEPEAPEPEGDDDTPGGEAPPEEIAPAGPPGGTVTSARRAFAHSRAKNRFERRVDFVRIERDLDGLGADAVAEIVPLMVDVRERFLKFVDSKFDGKASTVNAIRQLRGMSAVGDALGRFLETTMASGAESVRRELTARFRVDEPNFKPDAALRFLRAKKFLITGVIEDRLLGQAKSTLLRAIETGEIARETRGKLAALFEPYIGDPTVLRDGKPIKPAQLETVVRTNATDAFNRGRIIEGRQSGDLLQGFAYSAIIDERTTEVCQTLDGRVFKPNDPALDSLKPPRHFNCRSILVPVVVGVTVNESDFITPGQIGRGTELSGKAFK